CASLSSDLYFSAEARPYALLALLSTAWTAVFVLAEGPRRRWWLAGVSALFLQVHFLAAILVGPAWLWEAGVRQNVASRARALAAGAALLGLTAASNLPALRAMWAAPALSQAFAPPAGWLARLLSVAQLEWRF